MDKEIIKFIIPKLKIEFVKTCLTPYTVNGFLRIIKWLMRLS
jgi:hypothetical protein